MRRFKKSAFRKELKNAEFDDFENITTPLVHEKFNKIGLGQFISFYKNSIYSIQIYVRHGVRFAGIRRHDEKASCPWIHRQKIKNFIFGNEAVAVEYMPPEDELIDQANMFWIYCSDEIKEVYDMCNLKNKKQ